MTVLQKKKQKKKHLKKDIKVQHHPDKFYLRWLKSQRVSTF